MQVKVHCKLHSRKRYIDSIYEASTAILTILTILTILNSLYINPVMTENNLKLVHNTMLHHALC